MTRILWHHANLVTYKVYWLHANDSSLFLTMKKWIIWRPAGEATTQRQSSPDWQIPRAFWRSCSSFRHRCRNQCCTFPAGCDIAENRFRCGSPKCTLKIDENNSVTVRVTTMLNWVIIYQFCPRSKPLSRTECRWDRWWHGHYPNCCNQHRQLGDTGSTGFQIQDLRGNK